MKASQKRVKRAALTELFTSNILLKMAGFATTPTPLLPALAKPNNDILSTFMSSPKESSSIIPIT
jgi:hypothetical protein